MISFSEFLAESRYQPLYHGTSSFNATEIIRTNIIKGTLQSMLDSDSPTGVSLTRNFKVAKLFATHGDNLRDIHSGVVLEIDQQKLRGNYKVRPFNFFDDKTRRSESDDVFNSKNEFEELVYGNIKDADRYITKIILLAKPGKRIKGNLILNHPKLYYNGRFVNR